MLNLTLTDDGKLYAGLSLNTPIPFTLIGQDYTYQIDNLRNLKCLEEFIDSTRFETNTRLLKREWRLSLDGLTWSTWLSMFPTKYNTGISDTTFYEEIGSVILPYEEGTTITKLSFGELVDIDTKQTYHIQLKWTRIGTESDGAIFLDGFNLNGWWDRDTTYSPLINITGTDYVYYRVPEVWKVFKLEDFEIISDGLTSNRTLSVDYRTTQDSGRSWTNWESLTKGNISTLKFTPIRFFNIEYRIKRTGDTTGNVMIYEINLLGDFQNVTQDYYKSNKMGIRECCCLDNNTEISVGNGPGNSSSNNGSGTPQTGSEGLLMSSACTMPEIYTNPLGNQNLDALFKPYQLNQAVQLYNALSTITTQVFGFDVIYFLTSPEKNGTDYTFHEYQLFNVKCHGDIKVSVDDNQFPDNQIVFNQFDLSLFESFEIHITKEIFWKVFGIDERPAKEDFLWFCNLNRVYQVEHAQSYRDFNNSSVFWKVILKKYNQKGNVIPSNATVEDRINQLINNTTLDELMGVEKANDKEDVAFKDQHLTLSQDTIRYEFFVPIVREIIDNSTLLVARDHYDLSGVNYGTTAITYRKADNYVVEGNNRSFTFWFQLTNFIITEVILLPTQLIGTAVATGTSPSTIYTYSYTGSTIFTNSYVNTQENNLITNYDSGYNKGYKISIYNKNEIRLDINSSSYSLPLSATGLTGGVWYCYHVNLNQREKYVEHFLYKRNVTSENLAIRLKSPKLMLINSAKQNMLTVNTFENTNGEIRITGSDMKLTNIRIWDDIILLDNHTKVLNQNIVKDYSHIILADSANKKVTGLDNIPYN